MAQVFIDQAKKILTAHRLAGPHVRRVSNQVIAGARRLAPRGDHLSGSGKPRGGQALVPSLHIKTSSTVTRISEFVGSNVNHAATVHQGSQAHYIHGRGKSLKFEWERGTLLMAARSRGRKRGGGRFRPRNQYFYFRVVYHPGNKRPVRYLTTPMHLYGRIAGFRTSSREVNRSRLP